ncbi:MAG: flagellar basal body-associated FliL family protein [Alphaproteobacteria bacterium]
MSGHEAEQETHEEGEGQPRKKKLSGKKIVLFAVLALLLLGGGGAGLYFSGILGGEKKEGEHAEEEHAEAAKEDHPGVFVKLPDILVNLDGSKKPVFLKMTVSIEVKGPEEQKKLEDSMPRILDQFQVFLRALDRDDLKGSAGIYRLRQELLARVADVSGLGEGVKDVLFQEILVQ